MKIGLVSLRDPRNIRHWSGTLYFMADALRAAGHSVEIVGPLRTPLEVMVKAWFKVANHVRATHFDASKYPPVVSSQAKLAMRQIAGRRFDFLLCPSCIAAGYLETGIPVVTWEDNAFAGIAGYYPGKWMRYGADTLEYGRYLQQRSLDQSDLCVFSSDWAARSALDNYRVSEDKIRVIPFGANFQTPPAGDLVERALATRINAVDECRLLFIGIEWERKGGDTVLRTAEILHRSGVNVTVDIVGIRPPCAVPDYVRVHGFVSKAARRGRAFLDELFLAAHYLFVPSIAECYGLVYAEASAFGVPSLSRQTGGIPSVVLDGENGWLLPLGAPAEAYADLIRSGLADRSGYAAMARRARSLYEERFNWEVAVTALEREVAKIVLRY